MEEPKKGDSAPCHFCKKTVERAVDQFCYGCKTVTCEACDKAQGSTPWGSHAPEAHLEAPYEG